MIVFANTLRARPMVLTEHDIRSLSEGHGRDVTAELQALSERPFEVRTFGELLRVLGARLARGTAA